MEFDLPLREPIEIIILRWRFRQLLGSEISAVAFHEAEKAALVLDNMFVGVAKILDRFCQFFRIQLQH